MRDGCTEWHETSGMYQRMHSDPMIQTERLIVKIVGVMDKDCFTLKRRLQSVTQWYITTGDNGLMKLKKCLIDISCERIQTVWL